METGYIRFLDNSSLEVRLINNTAWMTINEIADLFGVNIPIINKQLKELFRAEFLNESEVSQEYRYTSSQYGECIRVYYNLDAITTLSYRIQSYYTKLFREQIVKALKAFYQNKEIYIVYDLNINEFLPLNLN